MVDPRAITRLPAGLNECTVRSREFKRHNLRPDTRGRRRQQDLHLHDHVGRTRGAIPVDIRARTTAPTRIADLLTEETGSEIRQLGVRVPGALGRSHGRKAERTTQTIREEGGHEACANAPKNLHRCATGRCRATMPTRPTTVNRTRREHAVAMLLRTRYASCKDPAGGEASDADKKTDRHQAAYESGVLAIAGEHAPPATRRAEPLKSHAPTGHAYDHTRSTARTGSTVAPSTTAAPRSRKTSPTCHKRRRKAGRPIASDTGDRGGETNQSDPSPTERPLARRHS